MTGRWSLLLLTPLVVSAVAGCPRGMPPPVFPEVSGQSSVQPGGQAAAPGAPAGAPTGPAPSGGESSVQPGGQTAAPGAPAGAPTGPPPSGGGTAGAPPGPPPQTGKAGPPAAVSPGKAGPTGRPAASAGTRAATKRGATKAGRPARGVFDFMSRLNDDQRKKLNAKMAELRAKNASTPEIAKAIGDMLKSWGIEVPDMSGAGANRRWGGAEFGKLTEEQRRQFFAKMGELRRQNASPEKIRAEAEKMLKGFGLDVRKIEWPTGRGARGAPGMAPPGGPPAQGKTGGPKKF